MKRPHVVSVTVVVADSPGPLQQSNFSHSYTHPSYATPYDGHRHRRHLTRAPTGVARCSQGLFVATHLCEQGASPAPCREEGRRPWEGASAHPRLASWPSCPSKPLGGRKPQATLWPSYLSAPHWVGGSCCWEGASRSRSFPSAPVASRCSVPDASRGFVRPRPAMLLAPAAPWPELRLPPTASCPTLRPPPVGPCPYSHSRSPASLRHAVPV